MKKKIIFLLSITLLLPVLTACNKTEAYDYSLKRVNTVNPIVKESGDFLVYSGNLEGNKETVLAMKSPGRIKAINAGIGDVIKKDQLLATLGGEENFEQRNTASGAYQNSIANLANTENLMMQKINDAQANLRIAEENLLAALSANTNEGAVSEEKVKDANLQLEMSELNYKNLVNTFEQKERDVFEGISSAVTNASILSTDVVSYLYSMNNSTLPDEDNDFKINQDFMVKTLKNKDDAIFAIRDAKNSSIKLSNFYKEYSGVLKTDKSKLFEGRDLAEKSLHDAKKALRAMNNVVADSVTHVGMSQSSLDAYRTSLVNYSYSVESMLLSQDSGVAIGLLGAKQALENLKVEKDNMLSQAKKQVELAKQKIELLGSGINMTKDDLDARVQILKAQVEQAKQGLETAKKYSGSQIQMAKTQSDLARGSLGLANVGVANTQIKAPYDGVVAEKYLEEGVIVDAGTPILKVADISSLKLVIYVPEGQIKYFEKGMSAIATSDSFSDEEFEAIVERISPKTEEASKKVRVEFSLPEPGYLKLGMMMKLKLKIENQESKSDEVLVVPFDAIQKDGEMEYVWVVVDSKIEKREIESGQIRDLDVEILNGLSLNDQIMVNGFDGLKEGEAVEVMN